MTVNCWNRRTLAAAALAALLAVQPAGVLAAETAPLMPGAEAQQPEAPAERLAPFEDVKPCRGVMVNESWLRQACLNGLFINLRLYTAMGDGVTFREKLEVNKNDRDFLCLYLQASARDEVIAMQIDQPAMDALKRVGVSEIVVADGDRYVRARYRVDELQAVRDVLKLGAAEQLCVSGEDAPVTVVSEDGVRRQVN